MVGELKPGWRRVKFGEVVHLGKESCKNPKAEGLKRYIALEHMTPNDLKIRSWGNIADGTTFTRRCRPGQVLFGKRRAYQRKVAICEFEALCSGDIYVFESLDPAKLLPELLPFICQTESFFEFAVSTSAGSLSPRTNWKSLKNYEFALPPLEEQRRMLRVFQTSLRTVETTRHLVEAAEVAGMAVANHYVKIWLADGAVVPLGRVLKGAPESGCSAPSVSASTGHYVLALSALSKAGYVEGELKIVVPTTKMVRALLHPGDLLISRSNTLERVGFVGQYRDESSLPVSFPDTMMRLHPNPKQYLSPALEMVFQSSNLRRSIMSIAAGTSASMKKINKRNLLQILIPVPSLAQQKKAIDEREAVADALRQVRLRARYSWDVHLSILHDVLQTNEQST